MKIFPIILLSFTALVRLHSQDENPPLPLPDIPRVFVEALGFWEEQTGENRLDVFVEVPYDALHFTKVNDLFHASYDITVDILDSAEKLVTERYWTETIETKSYEESVSPNSGKLSQKSFSLKPGQYEISLLMNDPVTKKTFQVKRNLHLRDAANAPIAMSDLMIVNRIDTIDGKKAIYPNISGNVANLTSGFYLFFEVYHTIAFDSIDVDVIVKNLKGTVIHADTLPEALGTTKKSVFVKVDHSKLLMGDYVVDIECHPLHPAEDLPVTKILAAGSRPFAIHWHGLPVSIVDLDQAIEQMQYVADKDVIDEMRNATPDRKRELFKAFWKKIDPTPNTERNELMEEYFSRVEYANKHFSHYIDGWKTDMGMVYIIFGVPSNVERHPFEIDTKPYEIWTYYEQNREFIFVDATGFGDYRLQNPIWDLWRTRPH